jgi:hypothetical protein
MRASDPHPKTLLLIDDDAISRELLALLLAGEGFAVLVCDSGKAALEHLRTVGLPYMRTLRPGLWQDLQGTGRSSAGRSLQFAGRKRHSPRLLS